MEPNAGAVGKGPRRAVAVLALAFIGVLGPLAASAQAGDGSGGIGAGGYHTCAIRASDDTLACWGNNGVQQFDNIPAGAFKAVSAGGNHTCAIWASDDTLACWGNNSAQQLTGAGGIPAGAFKAVSAGGSHTCAIKAADDTLACWGNNIAQQLTGDGGIPGDAFKAVSAGDSHTCAIKAADDTLACWGNNGAQQLENIPGGAFKAVSAGSFHTCAIKAADDTLACWGNNDVQQLTGAGGIPAGAFKAVSAGALHTCAIKASDDTLACWGNNGAQQFDNIPAGAFKAVSAGDSHTCAIKAADDTLACWGDNGAQQLENIPGGAVGTPGGTTDPLAVTNTNDAGPGSLRRALSVLGAAEDANPRIAITATGTLNLQSPLAPLTNSVEIDGPGANQLTIRRDSPAGFFRIFTIPDGSTVELSDLSAANGLVSDEGGAIQNLGDLTLRRVSLHDNTVLNDTNGYGGAIINHPGALLRVLNSTLSNNSVLGSGSGVAWGGAILNNSALIIRNSTLTGNLVVLGTNNSGGAIFANAGTVEITNSTIAANQSGPDNAGAANIHSISPLALSLQSTIVADPVGGPNCAGAGDFLSQGHNLSDSPGCGLSSAFSTHDQIAEPLLGALASNGGPTQTMAPSLTSPAIDAGIAGPGGTDQRGFARTVDLTAIANASGSDATDIGALELADTDSDGITEAQDNCPTASNPAQQDTDADGTGDACDPDRDNDGVPDTTDNCSRASNPDQADTDADGSGDACDPLEDTDADDDGVRDAADNCPKASNPTQQDTDADGSGDACDPAAAVKGCVVPDVKRGSKLAEVKSALTGAGCTLGKTTRKFSKVKKGRLIKLKTKAGTVLGAGAAVDVVLSKGPRPS